MNGCCTAVTASMLDPCTIMVPWQGFGILPAANREQLGMKQAAAPANAAIAQAGRSQLLHRG
jgi:hypothetical protein